MDSPSASRRSSSSLQKLGDDPFTKSRLLSTKHDLTPASQTGRSGLVNDADLGIRYRVDDVPPWYMCIVLGFQHYLTMFGSTASIPLVLAPALCLDQGDIAVSEILSTMFFVSGFVTILQSTFGIRLAIVQGGTFSFLVPAFAILSLPKWSCPSPTGFGFNDTRNQTIFLMNQTREVWQMKMCELQGAIITASVFQVLIGGLGLMGYILKYIGPLTIAPIITLVGIALFDVAANTCSNQWGIAIMTMVLVIAFSQYLRNVEVPVFALSKRSTDDGNSYRCCKSRYPIFKMFPMILAIVLVWAFCFILTIAGTFPSGHPARTDLNSDVIYNANWFRIPYPFQWGWPTFNMVNTLGMLAGVIAGILESVGDYYACARMSGAPPPPTHAVNRGILVEGIGCMIAGAFGTGNGTTSYSENIGVIGITKVGSRRVIQTAGVIMMLLGTLSKFGALFVSIPSPIIGGVFMTLFGMITAVGVSNLQYVSLQSTRNLFIYGFSVIFGLAVSKWFEANKEMIQTGVDVLDQLIIVLLSTSMFLGGTVAFILDNTVPGTIEERGIDKWRKELLVNIEAGDGLMASKCYELPLINRWIQRQSWTKHIAVCPTFNNYVCNCCKRNNLQQPTKNDKKQRSEQEFTTAN